MYASQLVPLKRLNRTCMSYVVVMGGPSVHCSQTEGHLQHCDVRAPDTKVGSVQSSGLCDHMSWGLQPMMTCFFCCSKNANNSESEVVLYELEVAAMARVILQG